MLRQLQSSLRGLPQQAVWTTRYAVRQPFLHGHAAVQSRGLLTFRWGPSGPAPRGPAMTQQAACLGVWGFKFPKKKGKRVIRIGESVVCIRKQDYPRVYRWFFGVDSPNQEYYAKKGWLSHAKHPIKHKTESNPDWWRKQELNNKRDRAIDAKIGAVQLQATSERERIERTPYNKPYADQAPRRRLKPKLRKWPTRKRI
mmetsp:Transcript_30326/g.78356  ORF Transcript_30326/g.78356 Transcript_30326/m.78356 type:complete len:199 (+) Transcript_30326:16-612(+)